MKNNSIINLIPDLIVGEGQMVKNMQLFPLFSKAKEKIKYKTLSGALKKNKLEITEVSSGGSVPNLKVTNKSKDRILLVDSEEVVGAKQNRILNTSILLKPNSVTIIPVSCTEAGRWSYESDKFHDSDNIAFSNVRRKKEEAVSRNLSRMESFSSDQGEVWNEISHCLMLNDIDSPTMAMKDTFEQKKQELSDYETAFEILPEQKGFVMVINGEIAGVEYFSRADAFKNNYAKLLRSFAMDAHLYKKENPKKFSGQDAYNFLLDISTAEFLKYKSPGHGWDYRISGSGLQGHALVYKNEVIHMVGFRQN